MFIEMTLEIKGLLMERKEAYLLIKETKEEFDFFSVIKPAFDEMVLLVEQWEEAYDKEKITIQYINKELIKRTKDQVLELYMQSFHVSSSKKMVLQLFKTVDYVLDCIISNDKNKTTT